MTEQQADERWKSLVLSMRKAAEGITQEEISIKTGFKQANISRIFNLKYCPTLRTFSEIAEAIGANISVSQPSTGLDPYMLTLSSHCEVYSTAHGWLRTRVTPDILRDMLRLEKTGLLSRKYRNAEY